MKTECKRDRLEFTALGRREVLADFEGGHVSSDCGVLLLREADLQTDLMVQSAECFTDHRLPANVAPICDSRLPCRPSIRPEQP